MTWGGRGRGLAGRGDAGHQESGTLVAGIIASPLGQGNDLTWVVFLDEGGAARLRRSLFPPARRQGRVDRGSNPYEGLRGVPPAADNIARETHCGLGRRAWGRSPH